MVIERKEGRKSLTGPDMELHMNMNIHFAVSGRRGKSRRVVLFVSENHDWSAMYSVGREDVEGRMLLGRVMEAVGLFCSFLEKNNNRLVGDVFRRRGGGC